MVYGGVGLGKHILYNPLEIEYLIKLTSVYYVTSEKFANQFIESLKGNKLKDFTTFYSNIDCLIVDDIQFLVERKKHKKCFSIF